MIRAAAAVHRRQTRSAGVARAGRPQGARLLPAPRLTTGAARAHEHLRAPRVHARGKHRGADHRRLRLRRDRRGLHRLQRVQVDDGAACRNRAVAARAAPGRRSRGARADGSKPGIQPGLRPRRPHRRRIADRLPVRGRPAADLRGAVAALRRGPDLPRAARVGGGRARRADDARWTRRPRTRSRSSIR